MLNKVELIGNVGAEPEIRYTQSGGPVVSITVATSRKYKDKEGQLKEDTAWHKCVLFGKIAEIAQKYVSKGSKLYLDGRLQTSKWQDKEGKYHYSTEIIVEKMLMLSKNEAKQEQEVQKDNFDYSNDVLF